MKKKRTLMLSRILKGLYVVLPSLLGLGIIFAANGLRNPPMFSFGLFVAGFSGVIMAIRREVPMALGSISGKSAVIQGVLLAILFWGCALIILLG